MDSETTDEILAATGRALCSRGYADLTVKDIAEESSLTTAAIHYHFDTKEALLTAYLDRLIERFETRLAPSSADSRERLSTLLEVVFTPVEADTDQFAVAMMELKAQAPYKEPYRNRFRTFDERIRDVIVDAVRDGTAAGHFEECDAEALARGVVTMIDGGHSRDVALGEDLGATRAIVESYVEQHLSWTSTEGGT